jgi:hypothetical protein
MANISELEGLLSSTSLLEIESSIANKIGCDLYKDNIPLLTGFIKEEVDASKLSIKAIERFLESNSDAVIDFGLKFLAKSNPQSLSIGIAITYSVYLIYLREKGEKKLLEYLQKRRIPKPQKLLEQLLSIKKEMKL